MTAVNLPQISHESPDPNLFSDVYANDVAIAAVLNGGVDNTNIAAAAGIALSKLANATPGQFLVASASGVITAAAPTGSTRWANTPRTPPMYSTAVANRIYFAVVAIRERAVLTGVEYATGSYTTAGNVKSGLYDSTGALVAQSTTVLTPVVHINQAVPFDAPYPATMGRYMLALQFSSTAGYFSGATTQEASSYADSGLFAMAASVSVPTTSLTPIIPIPMMSTY